MATTNKKTRSTGRSSSRSTGRSAGNRKRKPARAAKPAKAKAARSKAEPAKEEKKPKAKKVKAPRKPLLADHRTREAAGLVALGVCIFFLASLFSLQTSDGLLMGPIGRSFAVFGYSIFGLGSYLVGLGGCVISLRTVMEKETLAKATHVWGLLIGLLSIGVLLHLFVSSYRVAGLGPGGLLGENVAEFSRALVSTAGTALVAVVGLLLSAVIATPLRMRSVLTFFGGASRTVGQGALSSASKMGTEAAKFSGEVIRAVLPERDHDEYMDDDYYDDEYYDDEEELEDEAAIDDPMIIDARTGPVAVPDEEMAGDTEKMEPAHLAAADKETKAKSKAKKSTGRKRKSTMVGAPDAPAPAAVDEVPATEPVPEPVPEPVIEERKPAIAAVANDEESEDTVEESAPAPAAKGKKKAPAKKATTKTTTKIAAQKPENDESASEPEIVESRFKTDAEELKKKEKEAEGERLDFIKLGEGEYKLPSLDYLNYDESTSNTQDSAAMLELSARLTKALENYKIKGRVTSIRPGPVVTMYEFEPAAGVRVSKIVRHRDDIGMALGGRKVRIVPSIPGKAAVGIEVPNDKKEMVYLKEIIADKSFRNAKLKMPMALGKNTEGAPTSVDLAKMPHLLVAGTTGSGKSVSVNSMITSLLYNSTPEEVRMIMIDPKMLELSIYEGIPHLLLPVVTDPNRANLALKWAVDEMERRYGLLAAMGVRDISSYNKKTEKLRAQWEADKLQRLADEAKRAADAGEFDNVESTQVGQAELDFDQEVNDEPGKKLPYIVVVIDEFADLMMCAAKEVETSVARIAQKARACGIHLILATQRPSADVITGLIKANFPSRIACRVNSGIDSRTILDQNGAENLLGHGDMLFSDRGAAPQRLHGCYVDEEEIHQVVDFLKTQGKPVYNMDIVKPREEEDGGDDEGGDSKEPADALYDKAVQIVAESQRVSVSYLQRRLSVGYNRAAKMVERMEREQVVSPPDNKKQREVLIQAA